MLTHCLWPLKMVFELRGSWLAPVVSPDCSHLASHPGPPAMSKQPSSATFPGIPHVPTACTRCAGSYLSKFSALPTWLWGLGARDKDLSIPWVSCPMSEGHWISTFQVKVYILHFSSTPGSMSLQVDFFPFFMNGPWVLQMSLLKNSPEGWHFLLQDW